MMKIAPLLQQTCCILDKQGYNQHTWKSMIGFGAVYPRQMAMRLGHVEAHSRHIMQA
jgi:hypothetical protein